MAFVLNDSSRLVGRRCEREEEGEGDGEEVEGAVLGWCVVGHLAFIKLPQNFWEGRG